MKSQFRVTIEYEKREEEKKKKREDVTEGKRGWSLYGLMISSPVLFVFILGSLN